MFRNILIATDGSQLAEHAVEHGLGLARSLGASVTAVTVTDMLPTYTAMLPRADDVGRFEEASAAEARQILERVSVMAGRMGVACKTVHIADEQPAEGITRACKQHGCDVIVMATHGRRGLDRLLVGSQTSRVVASSSVPVLICR